MTLLSSNEWDAFLNSTANAHVLQTAAWGELKSAFGWQPQRILSGQTGAQILFRHVAGFSVAYLPKGPLGPDWPSLWPEVDRLCRQKRAIVLKVEPDCWDFEPLDAPARLPGFRADGIPVQPRRTLVVSLQGPESAWLERMKQKTRYNIRLAERKEITVRPTSDVDGFYALMQTTGLRDGFGVHSLDYYRRAYDLFHPRGLAELLLAEFEGRPLAALMVFALGKRAWYFYGASNDQERNRMPTYLLQFQAMRWAAARGCTEYDLWGVPDEDEDVLEAGFEQRSDDLWGVYRFKRGFGGVLRRAAPTYEKVYNPLLYALYRRWAARRGE
ncbi:MAG: peptidoglycan bridge formation glycyltransferase FemA/FemB family protein [Anaerolineaceae bacterium]|nr:peptidoglycan bridge formation glycyltransferase FemA/FemB family protein [Anaerolineaceae bacterium]